MNIYLFDFDNTIVNLPYKETIEYLDQEESLNPNLDFQASIRPQEAPEYDVENTVPWGTQENFYDKNRKKDVQNF